MTIPRRFRDLPLFWQIFLPMALVVGSGLLSALVGLKGLDASQALLTNLYEEDVQVVIQAGQLERLLVLHHQTLLEHLASEDAREMSVIDSTTGVQRERILAMFAQTYAANGATWGEAGSLINNFREQMQRYFSSANKVLRLSTDFEKEAAYLLLHDETHRLLHTVTHVSSRLLSHMHGDMGNEYDESVTLATRYLHSVLWLTALGVGLSLAIAWFISSRTARRMGRVVTAAQRLGEGDLDARVDLAAQDEFGVLGQELNHMAERTAAMVREREHRRETLRVSEQRYALAMRGAKDALWDWDLNTDQVYLSERWWEMLGHDGDEAPWQTSEVWRSRLHPEDIERAKASLRDHLRDRTPLFSDEQRLRRHDGTYLWVLARGEALRDATGKPYRMAGSITDITERKQAEQALADEKERAQVTLASINDAVITIDTTGHVQYLNPAAAMLTGWEQHAIEGRTLAELLALNSGGRHAAIPPAVWRGLRAGDSVREVEWVLTRPNGSEQTVELSAASLPGAEGSTGGAVLVLRDVTEKRAMAKQLSWRATHDSLTRLINRGEFEERLARTIAATRRSHGEHALCFLDLDQFKVVNDTCGHAAGDQLLRRITAVLQARVRTSDTLARLGGDEFGLLLLECSIDQAVAMVNELRKAIVDLRFQWEDKIFTLGCSAGLIPITKSSESAGRALADADSACYAAKEQGRNRTHVYAEEDFHLAQRRGEMHWLPEIHQALDENRFELHAQPIVPLDGVAGQPSHFEILVRMRGRDGQLVLPGAFIAAAERYDIMPRIDQWVVHNTLKQLAWCDCQSPDVSTAPHLCAINLSGASISDDEFLTFLSNEIQQHDSCGSRLCFEITETAAIANLAEAVRFIHALRELGCRFALDDFGSGLSSFAYLKSLPVDYLKIDGEFVKDMLHDPIDRAMVEAIHNVGRVMGIQTIAEYVETEAIAEQLRTIGVDYAQGWGIARPAPLREWLEKTSAATAER